MTFKASLSDVSLFRDAMQAIAELISEGIFYAKEDGIHFTATDPTMVTLVNFKFDAKAFDSYKVEGTQEIAINMDNLLSVLRRAKGGDKLTMEIDKGANKLLVTIKNSSTRKFTIPILDIEKAEIPKMDLDFPAVLEMRADVLSEGVEDASVVTDTVILAANPNAFQMISEGDLSKVELDLEKGNEALTKFVVKNAVKSKFSLDYLKKIVKASKLADSVKIELGSDYPVRVSFKAPDKAEISYILAPRVED